MALASEELAEGGGHIPVGADRPEPSAAKPGKVPCQLGILLAVVSSKISSWGSRAANGLGSGPALCTQSDSSSARACLLIG